MQRALLGDQRCVALWAFGFHCVQEFEWGLNILNWEARDTPALLGVQAKSRARESQKKTCLRSGWHKSHGTESEVQKCTICRQRGFHTDHGCSPGWALHDSEWQETPSPGPQSQI